VAWGVPEKTYRKKTLPMVRGLRFDEHGDVT